MNDMPDSADIRMTVDAMDAAHDPAIKTIVLATGDSDFSPLFRRLRELGKNIIGIGPKSPLSESVENSCSKFIYTDTAGKNFPVKAICENAPHPTKRSFEILKSILDENAPILLAALKLKMCVRDSSFDEKKLGFPKFRDFVVASKMADIQNIRHR